MAVFESFLSEVPTSGIQAEHERLLQSYDQEVLELSAIDCQLDHLAQKLPDAVVKGKGTTVEKL